MHENQRDFSFFDINQYKLDQEWLEHVRKYYECAHDLAECKASHERAKADLALVEAELDKEIRLEPHRFGFDKLTEKIVENTITLQPKYRKALAKALEAKHAEDVAQIAVNTLEHRKRALEKTVDLFLAGYFAAPKGKGDSRRKMEDMEAREALGGRMR